MKASIEYQNAPVQVVPEKGFAYDLNGKPIPKTETITLCAWCDADKAALQQLDGMGYRVSHGLCRKILHNGLAPAIETAKP